MSMRNPQNERYTVEREGRSAGSVKPRAASAKPASKAAASVRVETKKAKPKNSRQRAMQEMGMSKEEKKAAREKQREQENVVYTATSVLTNADEKYKKLRRIWWALLIAAVILTALSWATLSYNLPGAVSIVVLVLAYAAIIGALVMDFTVIRKRRNAMRDKVVGMTRKQQERLVAESYAEQQAKDAAKKARKEAKKAGKSADEIEAAAQSASDAVLGKHKAAVQAADDEAAAPAATESKKKAKEPEAPLTPEEERLARAQKVARDFEASRR